MRAPNLGGDFTSCKRSRIGLRDPVEYVRERWRRRTSGNLAGRTTPTATTCADATLRKSSGQSKWFDMSEKIETFVKVEK